MPDKTAIEWTDATWNPVHGCSKVSPGCAHCYAETLSLRYGHTTRPWTPENAAENVMLKPHKLEEPLKWREPRMVFVNSMSDLFHEEIPDSYIAEVFAIMWRAEQHTFQVLTKRPDRMRELLRRTEFIEELDGMWPEWERLLPWPLPNVWLGTSIENRRFVGRADQLRQTPAAVRFISAEPLLGPLVPSLDLDGIDWLIIGGESGPGHRPMRLEWVRDLIAACGVSGAAPFVKQLGGARPGTKLEDLPEDLQIREYPAVSA